MRTTICAMLALALLALPAFVNGEDVNPDWKGCKKGSILRVHVVTTGDGEETTEDSSFEVETLQPMSVYGWKRVQGRQDSYVSIRDDSESMYRGRVEKEEGKKTLRLGDRDIECMVGTLSGWIKARTTEGCEDDIWGTRIWTTDAPVPCGRVVRIETYSLTPPAGTLGPPPSEEWSEEQRRLLEEWTGLEETIRIGETGYPCYLWRQVTRLAAVPAYDGKGKPSIESRTGEALPAGEITCEVWRNADVPGGWARRVTKVIRGGKVLKEIVETVVGFER